MEKVQLEREQTLEGEERRVFGDWATELLSCPDKVVEVLEQRKYPCWKCGLGV